RSLTIELNEENKLRKNLNDEIRILEEERNKRIYEILNGQKLAKDLIVNRKTLLEKGAKLTKEALQSIDMATLKKLEIQNPKLDAAAEIKELEERTRRQINILEDLYKDRIDKIK